MAGCTCENWSLQDLSSALQDMHKDNKRIVVPMFQRGKRWKKTQEQKFIDSLIKGYPVGTMLFYETYEDKPEKYAESVNHILEVLGLSLFECYDMTEKLYKEVEKIGSSRKARLRRKGLER